MMCLESDASRALSAFHDAVRSLDILRRELEHEHLKLRNIMTLGLIIIILNARSSHT